MGKKIKRPRAGVQGGSEEHTVHQTKDSPERGLLQEDLAPEQLESVSIEPQDQFGDQNECKQLPQNNDVGLDSTAVPYFPLVHQKSSLSAAEVSPVTAHKDDSGEGDIFDLTLLKSASPKKESESEISANQEEDKERHQDLVGAQLDQDDHAANDGTSMPEQTHEEEAQIPEEQFEAVVIPKVTDDAELGTGTAVDGISQNSPNRSNTPDEPIEEAEEGIEEIAPTQDNEAIQEECADIIEHPDEISEPQSTNVEQTIPVVGAEQMLPETSTGEQSIIDTDQTDRAVETESLDQNTGSSEKPAESSEEPSAHEQPPSISPGPYSLSKIIDEIPVKNPEIPESENAQITCVEAWESNIYIGTSIGEILHMYKLDDEMGYILVSRQRFHAAKIKPVLKIILLTPIQRALVQCGSVISLFMLPEFSPANIGRIRDVNDVSLDLQQLKLDSKKHNYETASVSDDPTQNSVELTIFTKKCIRMIRVTTAGIRLIKDLNYANSVNGIRRAGFAAVATSSNYDLLDLEKVQKIPLFPVSQGEPSSILKPLIVPVAKSEFLFACGTGNSDPAMGMVVNINGDISRGTIPWASYPTTLIIDYPYTLSAVSSSKVLVHSLHNQLECQQISFTSHIEVTTVSHVFQAPSTELAEAITEVSLLHRDVTSPDSTLARQSSLKKSTVLVYGEDSGLYVLFPTSRIGRLMNIASRTTKQNRTNVVDELEEEIKEIDSTTEFGEIEKHISECLIGLILLQYHDFNQSFDYWFTGLLDPRLVLYIFGSGDQLEDDIQVYSVLVPLIDAIQKQYEADLSNEPNSLNTAIHVFYRFFLRTWLSNREALSFPGKKKEDTIKTLELCLLRECLPAPTSKAELAEQINIVVGSVVMASDEAVSWLQAHQKYVLLLKLYEGRTEVASAVALWKRLISKEIVDADLQLEFEGESDPIQKALEHLVDFIAIYCEDSGLFWTSVEWLIESHPRFALSLLGDSRVKVDINESRVLKLLSKSQSDLQQIKLEYLEFIVNSKREKQFLGDLVVHLVDSMVQLIEGDSGIRNHLETLVKSYNELSIPRMPFPAYMIYEAERASITKFLDLNDRLMRHLYYVTSETKTVTSQTEEATVVDTCFRKLDPFKEVLPYLTAAIHYKKHMFGMVVNTFCHLGDYQAAENFAVSLEFPLFIALKDSKVQNDDTKDTKNTKAESETLLFQIFEIYLELDETELIESFLNRFNMFSSSQSTNTEDVFELFDNFVTLLNRIPDKFRVGQTSSFLSKNLISIQDHVSLSNVHKAISKSESLSYTKALDALKASQP
ncbi:unnamed protein product [Kuraishia capsulata CBS 1993]|uniref:CNH domain-containing protein n=1 Tax=Kuraishia capsulata CBS 1993 TaxID=1382522 RepID=W6MWJ5_9ASCO|nr:uncharacterized protein KUCA_T00003503001 [Kuraishia capsulata CBS 1993]CDK27525.1 unnamed protein product [Kuraishia capsulata CBS 1993]